MTTTYSLLLDRCGLSLREAAAFHSVRPDTVKSWSAGRNPAPPGVIEELRALYQKIESAADNGVQEIERLTASTSPDEIEIGIAKSDAEANRLGFPCIGAHAAMLGIVAAKLKLPVRVVPRGSTQATGKAVRAHDFVLTKMS